jgi:predicted anti-sigma-YlaC factor YlaD
MKLCRKYKEQIALAVLEGERSSELSQHLENCAACRAYAEEIERVCGEHSQRAAALPEIEAPRRLNARVRDEITRSEGSLCCGIEIGVSLRRLLQAMGIAAAAAIIVVTLMQLSSREPTSSPAIAEATTPGVSETTTLAEPTFAAYHHRLARSVEELEATLRDYGVASDGEVLKASSAIDLP